MSGTSCLVERGPLMAQQTGAVIALLDRLFPLWTQPVGTRDNAEADFREAYARYTRGIRRPSDNKLDRDSGRRARAAGEAPKQAFELSVRPDYFVRSALPHTPNASP
jgi:hypothetical protein